MRIKRSITRSIKTERRLASTIDGGDEAGYSLPRRVIMLRSNLHGKLRQLRKNDFLLAWASGRNFSVGKSVPFFRRACSSHGNSYCRSESVLSFSPPVPFSRRNWFDITSASNLFEIALLNTLSIIKYYYYIIIIDGWVNQKLFIK